MNIPLLQGDRPTVSVMADSESENSSELPEPFERLTTKQLEAIRAAAAAGYFSRSGQATAEDVAEQLGVSRSTFLYHLRGAEEKVFEQTFEDLAKVDNHE
jgi:predicted DNA binding protein